MVHGTERIMKAFLKFKVNKWVFNPFIFKIYVHKKKKEQFYEQNRTGYSSLLETR